MSSLKPIPVPGADHPVRDELKYKLAACFENPSPGSAVRIIILKTLLQAAGPEIHFPTVLMLARSCHWYCQEIFDGAWNDTRAYIVERVKK